MPEEIDMPVPDRDKLLDLARRWRESGKSARVFAQEQSTTPWVLYYWRQQLTAHDRPRRRRRTGRVRLAPLHVVATGDAGGDVEILLVSGDRVRLSAAVSPETLRGVVEVLRARC